MPTILRWAKKVWGFFSHLDTVWSGITTFGITGVLGGILSGIAATIIGAFQNTDPLVLLIVVVGVMGLGFFSGNQLDLNRVARRRRKRGLLPEPSVEPDSGVALNDDWSLWIQETDRLVTSQIEIVDFRHLWNNGGSPSDEPWIEFILKVNNNTPLIILINSIVGRIEIDGDPCTLDARWPGGGSRIVAWNQSNLRIEQPLLGGRGKTLIDQIEANALITFNLGSVSFNGTNETVNEVLPSIHTGGVFTVDSTNISLQNPHAVRQIPSLRR